MSSIRQPAPPDYSPDDAYDEAMQAELEERSGFARRSRDLRLITGWERGTELRRVRSFGHDNQQQAQAYASLLRQYGRARVRLYLDWTTRRHTVEWDRPEQEGAGS